MELPPSHALVINELKGQAPTPGRVMRLFADEAFVKDLTDQALAALENYPYIDCLDVERPQPDEFRLFGGGGMSPYSVDHGCECASCRFDKVDHFARLACLYGTEVVIPDQYSWGVYALEGEEAYIKTMIMWRLAPLVEAGVLRYSKAAYAQCGACKRAVRRAANRMAKMLWQQLLEELDVFLFKFGEQRRLSFGSPLLMADDQEYRFTVLGRKADRKHFRPYQRIRGAEAAKWALRYEEPLRAEILRLSANLVFDARMAMFTDATLATSSRFASAGYRILAGRTFEATDLSDWEKLRSLRIPLLRRLGVPEVLRLRETAADALPAFRLRLRSELFSLTEASDRHERDRALAAATRLQQEALQLQAQLAGTGVPAATRREAGLVTLGATIALVGLTSGQPALAIGGAASLASMLVAAHNAKSAREKVHTEVNRQPAALLIAAQRLTRH